METLGIDALKNVIGAGYDVASRVIEITKETSPGGKKITIPEVIGSAGSAYDLVKAIPQARQAIEEVKDLTKEETNELLDWAEQELKLDNDKAEKIILTSMKAVLAIAELVEAIL